METIPTENNALVNVESEHVFLDTPISTDTQPNRRRKKKSIVWEHFTVENVGPGCRRACCKQCKQSFAYSTGSKVAGTSHLKRHISKGNCHVIPTEITNTPKRRHPTTTTTTPVFDTDRCRHEIAQMIIMHDYPIHIVEHPGFIAFVRSLDSRFDLVNSNTVQGDCIAAYLREKQNIHNLIESIPGRVSLTLDLWKSCKTTGYVFVSGQFVDNEWNVHRKLLNVVMEPYPESDSAFSHAVSASLSDWNIEGRLFSLTVNQRLTETGIDSLRGLLFEKNPKILDGQLLLEKCLARSLIDVAREGLTASQETVKKVRDCVKYVKTSEWSDERLTIDDQNQWNTTYEMLLEASELKDVFFSLDSSDPDYNKFPTLEEWKIIDNLCMYLKLFFDTANLLTNPKIPTTNMFFQEVWKIQLELTRAAATSEDPAVTAMQKNFDKYWKNSCLILAIAVVMDPRFKMKLVEFSFTKLYNDNATSFINTIDEGIHHLFLEYVALPSPPHHADVAATQSNGDLDPGLTDFDAYVMETTSQQSKSELDQYLEESLLPRVHEFDVIGWWKLNKDKYPILSNMARDILTVSVSSVGRDSVFETGCREMDRYRCSLRAETVEALVCAKDWLSGEIVDATNDVIKIEFPI